MTNKIQPWMRIIKEFLNEEGLRLTDIEQRTKIVHSVTAAHVLFLRVVGILIRDNTSKRYYLTNGHKKTAIILNDIIKRFEQNEKTSR